MNSPRRRPRAKHLLGKMFSMTPYSNQRYSLVFWAFAVAVWPLRPIVADAPEGYQLSFSEEFDGDQLDLNRWAYRADAKHRSIQRAENIHVADGSLRLHLTPLEKRIQGKANAGAGIVTLERFHYGYYEVRARLGDGIDHDQDGQVDEGWHHAFWAMFAKPMANADPPGSILTTYPPERRTEIDCYENADGKGGYNRFTQHVIIWKPNGKEHGRRPKPPTDHVEPQRRAGKSFDATKWNTYAFEWTAQGVQFFVNGEPTVYGEYPVEEFEHDRLNVWLTAIAANWCDKDPELSRAEYDYFRYYAPSSDASN
ncbi:glycoside hydrolase family 16 [Rhodopirellula sallentina SM41]|uniref:Glycoside hydrolase family 16 n=2 Tax=Rhodopirellula TaxID=265488 RepID=M5U7L3_9BACT|nr:glycoside hydrolase family 16 [Rhodopirellula sallentina SM41]